MNSDKDIEKLLSEMPIPEVVEGEHKAWLRAQLLAKPKQGINDIFAAHKRLVLAASLLLGIVLTAIYAYTASAPKAFAETLKALQNVTSMKCSVSFELPGEKPRNDTMYWVAPDKLRMDFGSEEYPIHETKWFEGNTLTVVDYKKRSAVVMVQAIADTACAQEGVSNFATPGAFAEIIRQMSGVMSEKEQDGHRVITYQAPDGSSMESTLDRETHLPLMITIRRATGKPATMIQRMEWNVSVASELMTPLIPDDIKVTTLDYTENGYPFDVRPGDGVGPVRFGMTREEVIQALGEPDAEPFENMGLLAYYRHGIEVSIDKKKKDVFWISMVVHEALDLPYKTFTGKTAEGIGIGSTEAEIVDAFGETEREVSEHDVVTLRYPERDISFTLQSGLVKKWGKEARVTAIVMTKPR